MSVVVTGASGFLGQRLLTKLQERYPSFTVLGIDEPKQKLPGVDYLTVDITDPASVQKAAGVLPNVETLIHLAALVPKTSEQDTAAAMYRVNVQGTINLLETWQASLQRVVYVSTAEVYGLLKRSGPLDESAPVEPPSFYAASKLAAEQLCLLYGRKHSFSVAVLRLSVLYGPGDVIKRALPNFIDRAIKNEPLELYGGEELRDYLHVDDACTAIVQASQFDGVGLFNIGTGQATSIKAAAEAVVQAAKSKSTITVLPRQKPAFDLVFDIAKAKRELDFEPKHRFDHDLESQIEFQRNHADLFRS